MQLERSYSPGKYFSPDKLYSNTKLNSSYFLTDPYKGMVLVLSSKIPGKSAFSAPQSEMAGAILASRMEQKISQELFNVSLSPPPRLSETQKSS